MATVGDNIKRLREAAGYGTQADLARAMGVAAQRVWDWENNRYKLPDTGSLLSLAKTLKCRVEDLLKGVDADYDDVARAVVKYEENVSFLRMLREKAREQMLREGHALPPELEDPHDLAFAMETAGDMLRRELMKQKGRGDDDFDDEIEDEIVDVSGFRRNDVPVIAEGDATPTPNLFWDDEGKLLSEVEDRITRPYDVRDPKAYGVRVRGDSMVTRLMPGDVAIVSPNTPVQDGDEVYAQLLSGERLLKVAHKMTGGWLLESYNRAYSPRQVKRSEIGAMHPIMWIRSRRRGSKN